MSDRATAKCPSCESPALERLGDLQDSSFFAGVPTPQVLAGGALFRCTNCCLKFRFPIETDATYARLYDHDQDSIWTDAIPRPDWDLIVSYIDKFGTTGKRVLDFGCNMGGLLARLADDNEKFGVEINRAAAAIAEAKHGVTVWPSVQEIPAEQRFDVIVAVDAVEHLPSPAKLIEELSGRLSPGGCLILTTGDANNKWWERFGANWWYCFNPEHIAFISRSWLEHLENQGSLVVTDYKLFRYRKLGAVASVVHAFFMVFYGLFPSAYLFLRNTLRRLLGQPDVASVPGNGVSADHLFVVLQQNSSTAALEK